MAHSSPQMNATRQQIVVSKHDINHSLREEMSRLEITCFRKKNINASIKCYEKRREGDEERQKHAERNKIINTT